MLFPLNLPPGVYRNGTNYQSSGRWYDASLVRWFEGTIRPVGGWKKAATTPVTGTARGIFPWRDYSQNRWSAIGTNSNLFIYNGGSIYDVTPVGMVAGRPDSFAGVGFGYGPYGTGAYGASPTVVSVIDANTWSFDNWGQYLVACAVADGKLYQWNLNISLKAVAIAGAPTNCIGTVVSQERYQMALGADGNPRLIRWCDQEDNTVWTPTSLNTAGDIELQTNGRIRTARRLRGEVVVWTDTDVHALEYLGPPFIYGRRRVGGFCGIAGPNAVSIIESGAVWMGNTGFFQYDGAIRSLPCDVSDHVFSDFNVVQQIKTYAGHNSRFGEVWWFYCSANSQEVDRYVIWNYRENHWSIGRLSRTCWADGGVFPFPHAIDPQGYLYEHENGWTDNGAAITAARYLKSGPVAVDTSGDRVISVNQVMPDEKSNGQVSMRFTAQMSPEGAQASYGPYTLAPVTDVRFTGRQVAMQIDGVVDADWRVGTIRLDGVAGGRR